MEKEEKKSKREPLKYTKDIIHFVYFAVSQIFKTNTDRNTIVANILEPMLLTRFIRIKPQSWYGKIALRLELYGCKPSEWTALHSAIYIWYNKEIHFN